MVSNNQPNAISYRAFTERRVGVDLDHILRKCLLTVFLPGQFHPNLFPDVSNI
jgi:hypothetical protein